MNEDLLSGLGGLVVVVFLASTVILVRDWSNQSARTRSSVIGGAISVSLLLLLFVVSSGDNAEYNIPLCRSQWERSGVGIWIVENVSLALALSLTPLILLAGYLASRIIEAIFTGSARAGWGFKEALFVVFTVLWGIGLGFVFTVNINYADEICRVPGT